MANVNQVVSGALVLLGVRVAESALEPNEAEDGLTALNDMMEEWDIDGINVGYEALDDVQDELYVKKGALGPIKANLAIYIADEYGRAVTPSLQMRARRGKNTLRGSISFNETEYPDSLPRGSGNQDNNYLADGDIPGGLRNSRFYPRNKRRQCS